MNPTAAIDSSLNVRVFNAACECASEAEKWRLQFLASKAREAKHEETRLKFFDLFNRLAADVLERALYPQVRRQTVSA